MKELIILVYNNSRNNILNLFLKKTLYIIIKNLKNQIITFNKVKQKLLK